jgi:uncharacterized membrane protein
MTLQPILTSPLVIQIHLIAAIAAFALGAWQLIGAKGTTSHRVLGWIWATLMMIVAASSFWISHLRQLGPFSFIHLLSILVLIQVPIALHAARRHNIVSHRAIMTRLFMGGLLLAGVFTLAPGRVLYRSLFGS